MHVFSHKRFIIHMFVWRTHIKSKKMNVLSGSKSVLIQTFLYKKNPRKFWKFNIPYWILNLLFLTPMSVNTLLLFNGVYVQLKTGGGLKEMSGSFYLGIGTVSIIIMYWLLTMNSKLIITLVDFVEEIVKKRKEFFFAVFDKFQNFMSIFQNLKKKKNAKLKKYPKL